MNEHEEQTEHHASDTNYERLDANPFLVGGALVVGMLLLGICVVLLNDYFLWERERLMDQAAMTPESSVLRDVRARETEILTTYAVADTAKGTYRIPVERAMKLMADEAYSVKSEK